MLNCHDLNMLCSELGLISCGLFDLEASYLSRALISSFGQNNCESAILKDSGYSENSETMRMISVH